MPIEYYELRGINWKRKYPSGMFRIIRDEDGTTFERMDKSGKWVDDPSMIRHITGYSDDAVLITKEEADKILQYFKKKKQRNK